MHMGCPLCHDACCRLPRRKEIKAPLNAARICQVPARSQLWDGISDQALRPRSRGTSICFEVVHLVDRQDPAGPLKLPRLYAKCRGRQGLNSGTKAPIRRNGSRGTRKITGAKFYKELLAAEIPADVYGTRKDLRSNREKGGGRRDWSSPILHVLIRSLQSLCLGRELMKKTREEVPIQHSLGRLNHCREWGGRSLFCRLPSVIGGFVKKV